MTSLTDVSEKGIFEYVGREERETVDPTFGSFLDGPSLDPTTLPPLLPPTDVYSKMMRIGVARVVFKNKNQAMFFSTVRFLRIQVKLDS